MRTRLAIVTLLMLTCAPAAAHGGHDAMTMILVMPDGRVYVSHRFAAHDLEPALADIAPHAQASLDDPVAITALVACLDRNFTLSTEQGPLPLTSGQIDLSSDDVDFAFVAKAARPIRQLTIATRVLADVYPKQITQMNVRYGDTVQTLSFSDSQPQTITIGRP